MPVTVITAAELNALLDLASQFYSSLYGSSASNYGAGSAAWGAPKAAADMGARIVDTFTGLDAIAAVVGSVNSLIASSTMASIAANMLSPLISIIQSHISQAAISNVVNLEQYLTYLNTGLGGTWAALQAPAFRDLLVDLNIASPVVANFYFELKKGTVWRGTTYANGLRKLLVGTGQTAGDVVDTAKYAGGIPYLHVEGYSGAPSIVTVTGTEWNRTTGIATPGKTWSVNVNGDGDFALAVGTAAADSLIAAASDITDTGGSLGAGTLVYAEAHRPAGRLAIT